MTPPRRMVSDEINLAIIGPKCLLPRKTLITADVNQTWLDLLVEDLNLDISTDEGFFVCSSHYCMSAPNPGQGWRAELEEQILHFVQNFMRNRERYLVRLCVEMDFPFPHPPPVYQSTLPLPSSSRRAPTPDIRERRITVGAPQRPMRPATPFPNQNCGVGNTANRDITGVFLKPRPPARRSTPRSKGKRPEAALEMREGNLYSGVVKRDLAAAEGTPVKRWRSPRAKRDSPSEDTTFRIPVISNVVSIPTVIVAIPPSVSEAAVARRWSESCPTEEADASSSDSDSDTLGEVKPTTSVPPMPIENSMDNVSTITTASTEGEELRQLGILPENVKPLVARRVNGLGNSFLLRLRAEHRRLQGKGTLTRNASRAPLTCFFVQELFRE